MKVYKVVKKVGEKYYSCLANGRYKLEYVKGKITTAIEGTLGIMVFPKEKDAKNFVRAWWDGKFVILPVTPIGKGTWIKTIARDVLWHVIRAFYRTKASDYYTSAVKGTKCYKAVRVL